MLVLKYIVMWRKGGPRWRENIERMASCGPGSFAPSKEMYTFLFRSPGAYPQLCPGFLPLLYFPAVFFCLPGLRQEFSVNFPLPQTIAYYKPNNSGDNYQRWTDNKAQRVTITRLIIASRYKSGALANQQDYAILTEEKDCLTIFFTWSCTGATSCSAAAELLLNSYSTDEDELLRRHELHSSRIRSWRTDNPLRSVDSWWGL